MQIAIIGLGRMGMNMAKRLLLGGHEVVAFNRTPSKTDQLVKEGAIGAYSLSEVVEELSYPRIIWIMLPAGPTVDEHINQLKEILSPYDIVITDMDMPHMDGKALGKKIKADPKIKDVKMVVLSSRGMRGDAAEMKAIGFSAYLTKPVRRSQLFDCLLFVLSGKKDSKDKERQLITRHTIAESRNQDVRILIAEDNIVNQKLALRLMEKFGFRADAVTNGKEAVRSLEIIPYDLVLMDVQMPEMDGLTATKRIRDSSSNVYNHKIPIIAMTAHAMMGDRERCLDAGMNDYISKPINPGALQRAIERQLSHLSKEKTAEQVTPSL